MIIIGYIYIYLVPENKLNEFISDIYTKLIHVKSLQAVILYVYHFII